MAVSVNSLIVVHELTSLAIHIRDDGLIPFLLETLWLLFNQFMATILFHPGNILPKDHRFFRGSVKAKFLKKKKTSCTCLGLSSSCSICLSGLSRLTPPQGTVSKLQLSTQGKLQLSLKSSKNTIIDTLNNKKS